MGSFIRQRMLEIANKIDDTDQLNKKKALNPFRIDEIRI